MVKLYKVTGFVGIIAGIGLFVAGVFFNNIMDSTSKIQFIAGGIAGIIYGIFALIKADYFERLETVTAQTRANTKLLLDQLNQQQTTPPTPAATDPLDAWKPSK